MSFGILKGGANGFFAGNGTFPGLPIDLGGINFFVDFGGSFSEKLFVYSASYGGT
jgi:hypothetical protein